MAKRTVSFKNYEEPTWEEYTGEDPPLGKWFNAKATRLKYMEEDDQIMVIFEITDGDFAGWGRGVYLHLDPDHNVYWKTQQTIKALQGGIAKDVSVDFENEKLANAWLAKQKPVKVKTEEYRERVRIGKVAPLLEAVAGAPKAATPAPEPEADEDGPVEDYTVDELEQMEVDELVGVLTDEFDVPEDELPKKPRRGGEDKYKELLIEAILDEQEAGDEDDDPNQDAIEDAQDGDDDFEDGFDEDDDPEPEPDPEPVKPARRSRAAATKTAPAKAAPAKTAAPAARRRRG